MFSVTEMGGQSSLLHKSGTVEIHTTFDAGRKPVWLVLLKLLGTLAMIAVGAAIAVPTLLEFNFPIWQAVLYTVGGMLIYTGVAFFIRPEANTDNLGVAGGIGNDPYQTSDNFNRFLWRAHCVLGPGRFTAETFLDLCALAGLTKCAQAERAAEKQQAMAAFVAAGDNSFDPTRPIAPLDPNRFAQSSANFVAGQIKLDTQRFQSSPAPPTPEE